MPGLREIKKGTVRKNILDAASKIFYTQGYEHASIAEIAKQANTGVGTCYNYFPSKANLFCESVLFVREDLWEEELKKIKEKNFSDPTDGIIELIRFLMESIRPMEKPLLREFLFGIGQMYMHNSSDLYDFFISYTQRRYEVISIYKEMGVLPADLDNAETMTCIFSMVIVQIVNYAVNEEITAEAFLLSLRSQISLFFRGKCLLRAD